MTSKRRLTLSVLGSQDVSNALWRTSRDCNAEQPLLQVVAKAERMATQVVRPKAVPAFGSGNASTARALPALPSTATPSMPPSSFLSLLAPAQSSTAFHMLPSAPQGKHLTRLTALSGFPRLKRNSKPPFLVRHRLHDKQQKMSEKFLSRLHQYRLALLKCIAFFLRIFASLGPKKLILGLASFHLLPALQQAHTMLTLLSNVLDSPPCPCRSAWLAWAASANATCLTEPGKPPGSSRAALLPLLPPGTAFTSAASEPVRA